MRGNDRIVHSSGGGAGASGAGYAPVAQAAEGDETLSSQLAEEAELLAAGVDVDEKQTPELYDTNIEDANCHQLVLVVRFAGDTTGDGDTGLNAVPTGQFDHELAERLHLVEWPAAVTLCFSVAL